MIIAVDGESIAGVPPRSRRRGSRARRERRSSSRSSRAETGERARARRRAGRRCGSRPSSGEMRDGDGQQGRLRPASRPSARARTASSATRSSGSYREGAEGIVLDLRGNGGGLLNEAVLSASIFVEDGTVVVSTRAGPRATADYEAVGDALDRAADGGADQPRHRLGGRDPHRRARSDYDLATVVGTRTYGKGTFQEVIPLAAGGALDLTIGAVPDRRRDLARRQGRPARRPRRGRPRDRARDEGLDAALARARRAARAASATPVSRASTARRRASSPSIAGAGRFLVAEPLFERGPQVGARARVDAGPRRARSRWSSVARQRRPRARRARRRRTRRATSSRRCSASAASSAGFRAGARGRGRERRSPRPREATGARRDLTALPTFTVDPASARDFDDAVSAERARATAIRLWIHIADVAAHVRPGGGLDARGARRAATSTYVPGHGRADAAAGAQRRRLQPRARASSGSRSPPSSCLGAGGEAALGELLPQPDPLRRAARLRPARPSLRRPRAPPRRGRGAARARPPRRRRARRARRRRARGRAARARVRVRRRRRRDRRARRSPRPRRTG